MRYSYANILSALKKWQVASLVYFASEMKKNDKTSNAKQTRQKCFRLLWPHLLS